MSILECQNLKKSFGKKEIIKGVSFKIDEGTVIINCYDIKKDFVKAIEKVGTIVENPDMYMYLTGRKNLELIANLYKDISNQRINEIIKLVGLENRIDDKVGKYSLGMRQRLGIAQAILHRPNLLVLDEPTNGLDPEGIIELRNLLKKLAKNEKMAILISSHNLLELESFCNKVCIIQNGEVIEESNIKDLKNKLTNSIYFFEVSNTEKIKELYKDAKIKENGFEIKINKEDVTNVIKNLIKNEIDIYQISKKDISLEEVFIKKTGGNIID